jgi:hypothetical protein
VFPAGHIDDRRSFHYRGADGSMILVHLLELDTDATDLEGWATAGRRLVASIREAVGAAI